MGFLMQGNNVGFLLGPAAVGAIAMTAGWPAVSLFVIAIVAAAIVLGLAFRARPAEQKSIAGNKGGIMNMDPELIEVTKRLIRYATRYDIETLDTLYSDDLKIYRLDDRGETMTLDKPANMAYFIGKRDAGAAPLDDAAEFLHASQSDGVGMVVVKRTMQLGDRPEELFFTLIWRRGSDGWKVIRESAYAQAASLEKM